MQSISVSLSVALTQAVCCNGLTRFVLSPALQLMSIFLFNTSHLLLPAAVVPRYIMFCIIIVFLTYLKRFVFILWIFISAFLFESSNTLIFFNILFAVVILWCCWLCTVIEAVFTVDSNYYLKTLNLLMLSFSM